jgi:hypothetical protein
MKTCSTCNIEKEDILFRKNRGQCIGCFKTHRAEYRSLNKDKIKDSRKIYYENNSDKVKANTNFYYHNNKDKVKDYLEKNKDMLNGKRRVRTKSRYKNDVNFKLRKLVSGSILQSLLSNQSYKIGSILQYLPYTIQELKEHLEKQFELWMTWDNISTYKKDTWDDTDQTTWTWQIDHIIPHSTFNYTSMEDQAFKECWALSNLRPYSAKQNWLDGINRTRHITVK